MRLRVATVGIIAIASVAIAIAAYQAANVFAPLALAIFMISIVWPLQNRLQLHMPKLVALAITLFLTTAVCIAFASLAVWAFGRVGHSLIADSARYQALYLDVVAWLDDHGVSVALASRRSATGPLPHSQSLFAPGTIFSSAYLWDIRQRDSMMHTADRFLKFATECQVMAQRAPQRENKRAWDRLAERWRRCAKLTEQLDKDLRSSELRVGNSVPG